MSDDAPRHVDFDGIAPFVPLPMDGGQGRMARAFGVSRRTIARWKKAGRIPFYSADRAVARVGEHPISYWPEAFGLPKVETRPEIPDALKPIPRPELTPTVRMRATRRDPRRRPHHSKPRDTLSAGPTRVLLAVVHLAQTRDSFGVADVALLVELSKTTTWQHLAKLRDAGLVTWIDGTAGTIRPTVRCVTVIPSG